MAELKEVITITLNREEKDIIGEALSAYIPQAKYYNDINKPDLIIKKLDIIDHLLEILD